MWKWLESAQVNVPHDEAEVPAAASSWRSIERNSSATCEGKADAERISAQTGYNFMLVSRALGMSDEAHLGWAKLHVKPHLICLAYFASIFGFILFSSILYGFGLPWPTLIIQIPFLASVSSVFCMAAMIHRSGPMYSNQPPFMATSSIFVISTAFVLIASFVGPRKLVPFDSQLVNVLGSVCFMFSGFCAGAFGGTAADHPPQPYNSLGPPLWNAAFSALRFTDIMTDFGFVRILLQQGPDCQWFGADVPCSHYTHLAITDGCIAGVNVLLSSVVTVVGGQEMLFSSAGNMFKVAVTVNAAIATTQLGTIFIAALKVISDLQLPESSETPRLRREIAFAIISCLSTIGSFCVNVVGMRRVVGAVGAAAVSVRQSVRLAVRGSAAVAPTPVPADGQVQLLVPEGEEHGASGEGGEHA